MKKVLFTFFALLALLLMSTGTAFAAPLQDGYLVLLETRNDSAGGVIFVFEVMGEFTKKELRNGFVTEGDNKYPMHCNLDGAILQCTTSRATAEKNVTINLNGFIFWTYVPNASAEPTQYCYGVYDAFWDEEEDGYAWEQFTTYCQDVPASLGEDY